MTAQVFDLQEARAKRTGLDERWVPIGEVAERFSVSTRTVERWASRLGPDARRKFSRRLVRYRLSRVEAAWDRGDLS